MPGWISTDGSERTEFLAWLELLIGPYIVQVLAVPSQTGPIRQSGTDQYHVHLVATGIHQPGRVSLNSSNDRGSPLVFRNRSSMSAGRSESNRARRIPTSPSKPGGTGPSVFTSDTEPWGGSGVLPTSGS